MVKESRKSPIYLDCMATTPVDPAVQEAMLACLEKEGGFGNPSSNHYYGWEALSWVNKAREQVADLVNVDPREIIWTSGATESDNLAIKGAARFYQRQGKHIVTMSSEHKAVLDTCAHLETEGFEVTYLDPEPNGLLDLEQLKSVLRKDTVLVSVMHVNNETGVIQDLAAIGKITREKGILLHADAAQSAGKIPIDLQKLNVDLMSFSAHKVYGPKGIGALYVRSNPPVRLEASIHGGGHQKGLRSGTLPTQQIVGMGVAFSTAKERLLLDREHIARLRERFWKGINGLVGLHLNGSETHGIAGCLNVYFDGVEGESLMLALRDLAVSSGSACNSANSSPSHVLSAMGLPRQQAYNSVRISLGRFTTEGEVDCAVEMIRTQVNRLRLRSPLWPSLESSD